MEELRLKKDVMLSVSGKYTEPIFSGDKWWEVRKTAPYLLPPFTVYLYETKSLYTAFGLGNAVVPQCFYLVFRAIRAWMEVAS